MSRNAEDRAEEDLPTIRASLEVLHFGDDPAAVTQALGIEPSRAGQAGEPHRNAANRLTSRVIGESFWELRSDAGYRASVEAHTADLLDQMRFAKDRIALLPAGSTLLFRFTIIPAGSGPYIFLPAKAVRELGEIGAAVEIRTVTISGVPEDLTT